MNRERFLRITTAQFTGIFSATIGIYMLLIWLGRRHDSMYGYFGLAALTYAVGISSTLGYWAVTPNPLDI